MANIVKASSLGEWFDEDRTKMTKKRRDMIHKHRKHAEIYGPELPFEIGVKQKKLGNRSRDYIVTCDKCGHETLISSITYMVGCPCGEIIKIED